MADWKTRAVFLREFHWQRPASPIGFGAKALTKPQSFPRDFIAAALRAGAAVAAPRKPSPAECRGNDGE